MDQPISAGCLAEVIDGLKGRNSPNLGLIVRVLQREGDHSLYGTIWLCKAEYAVIGQEGTRGIPAGTAHFAQAWLRRLPPDTQPPAAAQRTKESSTC